jgi:mannose-1-phosphate guanylyltransferase
MLVLPADQRIQPQEGFQAALRLACRLVDEEPRRFVTLGIRPTYPAETFGYIERGELLERAPASDASSAAAYRVRMFREKPSAIVAEQYLRAGGFYWNSGIFAWKAAAILDALHRFEPAMHAHLMRIADAWDTPQFAGTLNSEFTQIQGRSIDYAVMERYDNVVVVEATFDWDDVGSWGSLARTGTADEQGNSVAGRHLGLQTRNCVIQGDDAHLIVTVGLEDYIVVHTPDATLIAHKSQEEAVRHAVNMIQERGWTEYL